MELRLSLAQLSPSLFTLNLFIKLISKLKLAPVENWNLHIMWGWALLKYCTAKCKILHIGIFIKCKINFQNVVQYIAELHIQNVQCAMTCTFSCARPCFLKNKFKSLGATNTANCKIFHTWICNMCSIVHNLAQFTLQVSWVMQLII